MPVCLYVARGVLRAKNVTYFMRGQECNHRCAHVTMTRLATLRSPTNMFTCVKRCFHKYKFALVIEHLTVGKLNSSSKLYKSEC